MTTPFRGWRGWFSKPLPIFNPAILSSIVFTALAGTLSPLTLSVPTLSLLPPNASAQTHAQTKPLLAQSATSLNRQDPTWQRGTVELLTITHENGGHTKAVRAVVFHPDSRFLATGGVNKDIKIWDLQGRSRVKIFTQESEVLSLAFSPDGRWLASGDLDGNIRIWNWRMGQLIHTLTAHTHLIADLAFTPNSQELISGSGDQTLKIWNVKTGENVASFDTGQFVQALALDPKTPQRIATAGLGRRINLLDRPSRRQLQLSQRFPNAIYSLAWHPNLQQLAFSPNSSTLNDETDIPQNTIVLLDIEDGEMSTLPNSHADYVSFVTYSSTGETLLSGSWDNTIKLWNPQTGELLRQFLENEQRVLSGSFSADGKAFVIGSGDGSIKIYLSQALP
ncbi:MAG: WD40 repeat domain-containing protein [Cyanobacteria bacterium P01_D01_bin.105]